jgi:hypothetical protein
LIDSPFGQLGFEGFAVAKENPEDTRKSEAGHLRLEINKREQYCKQLKQASYVLEIEFIIVTT